MSDKLKHSCCVFSGCKCVAKLAEIGYAQRTILNLCCKCKPRCRAIYSRCAVVVQLLEVQQLLPNTARSHQEPMSCRYYSISLEGKHATPPQVRVLSIFICDGPRLIETINIRYHVFEDAGKVLQRMKHKSRGRGWTKMARTMRVRYPKVSVIKVSPCLKQWKKCPKVVRGQGALRCSNAWTTAVHSGSRTMLNINPLRKPCVSREA